MLVLLITFINSMVIVIWLAYGMKYFVAVVSKTQEDINLRYFPSCYLLVQTQQKHWNNMQDLFKVNKDTGTIKLTSF